MQNNLFVVFGLLIWGLIGAAAASIAEPMVSSANLDLLRLIAGLAAAWWAPRLAARGIDHVRSRLRWWRLERGLLQFLRQADPR